MGVFIRQAANAAAAAAAAAGAGAAGNPAAGAPPRATSWQDGWFTGPPPQDRLDHALTAVNISFTVVALIVFGMRVVSRAFINRIFTIDDWMMTVGVLGMLTYTTSLAINIDNGLGQHVWNLVENQSKIKGMLIQSLVCQISYTIAMGFIKISFVYQLLEIIPNATWRKVMWYFMLLLSLYYLAATLSISLNCIPASYAWERLEYKWNPKLNPKTGPKGKCLDLVALQVSIQAVGLLTDLLVWIFPVWLIARLSLPPREKYSLLAVFTLGALAVAACVLRLHRLTQTDNIDVQRDPPFGQAMLSMWSIIEICTAIICACLPTCRPLLKKVFPNLLSYSEDSRPGKDDSDTKAWKPAPRASQMLQSYSSSVQYDEDNRQVTPPDTEKDVDMATVVVEKK